jgi:hypothetical protein
MNQIDQYLLELGLKDPSARAQIAEQVELYAVELAIGKLAAAGFTDQDQAVVDKLRQTKTVTLEDMQALFSTPQRKQYLADSLQQAVDTVTQAAAEAY